MLLDSANSEHVQGSINLFRANNEALLTVQAPREDREQQLERAAADRGPEPHAY